MVIQQVFFITMILYYDLEANAPLIDSPFHTSFLQIKKKIFIMSTVYEIVYHKEHNMFSCFCGYMRLNHHCTRKMRGFIKFVSCPTDCRLCEKEADRKEYNSFRQTTDRDGYSACGSCYSKLRAEPICSDCFCQKCYSSLSEKRACFKD